MSGRYFSLPYLTSVALLSTILWRDKFSIYIAVVIIGLLSLAPLVLIAERRPSYKGTGDSNTIYFDSHKISDERMVYSERTSLSISLEGRSPKIVYYDGNDWIFLAKYPTSLEMYGAVGMNGYRAGPNVHVLDRNGLIDPLMARMPVKQTSNWRIGHFHHTIPAGYEETLIAGENLIEDKNVARYYDKLSYVIHGPLWDWDRIIEIWNLNTGKYEYLIEGVTPESTSE